MAFLANDKFKEILNASRGGNEKAKMIMQAMRKGQTQDDVNRLVDDYYNIGKEVEEVIDTEPEIVSTPITEPQNAIPDELEPEIVDEPQNESDVIDLTDILNAETEGLFDEDEYESVSFYDFLKNKKTDANRALKNADYFKAFDLDGRNRYADGIVDTYRHKFDNNLRNIEREYADNDRAITGYLQSANDMLDDGVEFGVETATKAYNDLIDDENAMGAFGRYWDENDSTAVLSAIKELVDKYGKANVISALNVLKGDNSAHRDYLNNSIDANISKYAKNVDKLLR